MITARPPSSCCQLEGEVCGDLGEAGGRVLRASRADWASTADSHQGFLLRSGISKCILARARVSPTASTVYDSRSAEGCAACSAWLRGFGPACVHGSLAKPSAEAGPRERARSPASHQPLPPLHCSAAACWALPRDARAECRSRGLTVHIGWAQALEPPVLSEPGCHLYGD